MAVVKYMERTMHIAMKAVVVVRDMGHHTHTVMSIVAVVRPMRHPMHIVMKDVVAAVTMRQVCVVKHRAMRKTKIVVVLRVGSTYR